ncbi:hypothetical protein DXG01_015612 [Tephrocybe rancida]|nr:hypothetical protein DXG01_015612 [Tephrocybe rancida]
MRYYHQDVGDPAFHYLQMLIKLTSRIELRSLAAFVKDYTWSFTLGLALSSFLDVIITVLLCTFLMEGRKKNINARFLDALCFRDWVVDLSTRTLFSLRYGARLSVSGSNGDRGLPMYGSDLRRLSRNPSSKRISHLDGTPIKRLSHLDEQKPLPGHLQIKVEEMTIRTVDHDSDHHRTVDSDHHLAPARESAASSF